MTPKVAIVRCENYDRENVEAALKKAVDLLGGIGSFIKPGSKALLKPNLLSARAPDEGVTTHPEIIRAVGRLVRAAGANPLIGDSPASCIFSPEQVYEATGVKRIAEEEGFELVKFDNVTQINNFPISKYARDCDYIISIPKLKTHGLMTVTCAVKNLFGVVIGLFKTECHKLAPNPVVFAKTLIDVLQIAKPTLTIVDAVVAMEGDGPSNGNLRNLNLVIAGNDAVAVDAVISHMIGLEPEDIPTTKEANTRGLGEADLEKIEILGEDLSNIRIKDFKLPKSADAILIKKIPNSFLRQFAKLIRWKPAVDRKTCTRCRECIRICPVVAMSMKDNQVRIDYKKCILCLCCLEVCPYKSVYLKKSLLVTLTGVGK